MLLESRVFDVIAGLPMHPLVVHAAVVLLPLSAIVLAVLSFTRLGRQRFTLPAFIFFAIGTVAAFVAKESGEALAARVGMPDQHAEWGSALTATAAATLVVAGVWWFLQSRPDPRPWAVRLVGLVMLVGCVAVIVLTVLVGHTGAEAVWGNTTAGQ